MIAAMFALTTRSVMRNKMLPYARCAPTATVREIAENWDLSNRGSFSWKNLTPDERGLVIHNTYYPLSSCSIPLRKPANDKAHQLPPAAKT